MVDVKNPQVILHVNIRKENTYLYLKSDETQALGGFLFLLVVEELF
ncbi:THUMP domain-containing protein [Areca yellow leaf disease phytoplasma]